MIKANELRIDNWVKIKEGYCKVRTIEDEDGIFAGVVSNDNDSVWDRISMAYSQPIEPIPLTPEILEKAGFVESSHIYKHKKVEHNILLYNNNRLKFEQILFLYASNSDNVSWGIEIKYLHQLQNLYFALTWEELEINL